MKLLVPLLKKHRLNQNDDYLNPKVTGTEFKQGQELYYGSTPLHFAVVAGHLDIVEYLLQNGAVLDAGCEGLEPKWTNCWPCTLKRSASWMPILECSSAKCEPSSSDPSHTIKNGDNILHILAARGFSG